MEFKFQPDGLYCGNDRIGNFVISKLIPLYDSENIGRLSAIEIEVAVPGYSGTVVVDTAEPVLAQINKLIPLARFWGAVNLNEFDAYIIERAQKSNCKKIFFRDNGMHRINGEKWIFVAGKEIIGESEDYLPALSPNVATLKLASCDDVDERTAITRIIKEMQANCETIIPTFCYTLLSSLRRPIMELGLSTFPILYIVGKQGLGKTVLTSRYCLLYDNVKDGTKYGKFEGNSTAKGIMKEIAEASDMVILVDDLAKASDLSVQRERTKVFAEILRFAANGQERKTASAAKQGTASLQCHSGVAFTGEIPLTSASDITRTIQIRLDTPMTGGEESDRVKAAITFRAWIRWLLPRFDEEIGDLRKRLSLINGGAEARLETTKALLNWASELFFRFALSRDIIDEDFCKSAIRVSASVFERLIGHQNDEVNRIQDYAPLGNLSWHILQAYKDGAFHIVADRKAIQNKKDCFIEEDALCIRNDTLLFCLRQIPAFSTLGEKQLTKKLRKEGALLKTTDGRSADKRINNIRYLKLVFSLLKDAAISYT